MELFNPDVDPNAIYFNVYSSTLAQPVITPTVGGDVTIITTINGNSGQATGPTITLSGGTTGLTFTASAGSVTLSGTLVAANGGTGISSYTQGDLIYASAATTISKLAKDTNASRYLSNTGTSNNPAWAQVNLANGVTGVLPNANGGFPKVNNNASAAPGATDDGAAGYAVASIWCDTTADDAYICLDATNSAAVWKKISP